jgi:hypothetical protein
MVKITIMIRRLYLIALLFVLAFIRCSTNNSIIIPIGRDIKIDGILEDSEWSDAWQGNLVNGGEVLFKHNNLNFFIGIRGVEMGWSHICVATPNQVLILHSSAALGAAIYQRTDQEFANPVDRFKWEMRDTTQSEVAVKARASYLDKNNWVASTAWMGNPFEREYIIKNEIFREHDVKIAVLYASDEEHPDYYYWPTALSDDALNANLAFGKTPDSLTFRIEQWATLVFD